MAVTAAPTRKGTRLRGCRAGEIYGQVLAGMELNLLSFKQNFISVSQLELHIRYCGPYSGWHVPPSQWPSDPFAVVRLLLSTTD